jgi:hypothetical protein
VDGIVKAGGPAGEALLDDEVFLAQQALEPPGPALGFIEADAAVGAVAGVGAVAVGVAVAEADDVFFHDFFLPFFLLGYHFPAVRQGGVMDFRHCAVMEPFHFVTYRKTFFIRHFSENPFQKWLTNPFFSCNIGSRRHSPSRRIVQNYKKENEL